MVQRVASLTLSLWMPVSRVPVTAKAPVVSLSKKLYPHCLALVGSRNKFERGLHKQKNTCFTIKLK